MFDLKLIPHNNLSQKYLDEIIHIKSIAWPYSYEKQLEWINFNLKDSDIHVLLYLDEEPVAYLNLIEIKLIVDEIQMISYGIGNVCAKEKGKGWGKELISQTNAYLTQTNKIGLLFCKNLLVEFYKLNNWRVIEKECLSLRFNDDTILTLTFNLANGFQELEYFGRPF